VGVDETTIGKLRFVGLIDLLSEEMGVRDKRKLGLSFYKTSSLRAIRNELEHRGYRYRVTRNQMMELLTDHADFESGAFESKQV